ncbi:hypothetical protein Q9L58_002142 [Maublancomyces gigas]|uniref:Uncharacterized protein n=1 Tax=Discina gigas TaxID=1032678 RepID=A0ABR3GSK4_9PEZI
MNQSTTHTALDFCSSTTPNGCQLVPPASTPAPLVGGFVQLMTWLWQLCVSSKLLDEEEKDKSTSSARFRCIYPLSEIARVTEFVVLGSPFLLGNTTKS